MPGFISQGDGEGEGPNLTYKHGLKLSLSINHRGTENTEFFILCALCDLWGRNKKLK
jgi:hypothetical protein